MKLILLRHEKREIHPGFFSSLTEEGLEDSKLLIDKFKKYKIDQIYCSPLLRTLQTIYPYCIKNKRKVTIEYALHEYKHNPYFLIEPKIYDVEDLKDNNLLSIVSKKGKSKFKKEDFQYDILENENNLEKRLLVFFKYLKKKEKQNSNQTLLLVSHKGVINKIKQMINHKTGMDDEFPKGHFEIIEFKT